MEGLPLDVIRSCIVPYLSILEIHSLSCTSRMLRRATGHHPHLRALQNLVKDYTPERVLIETAKRQDPTLFFYILGRRGGRTLDMATFQSIARVTNHFQVFQAAVLLCPVLMSRDERVAYEMTVDFHTGRLGVPHQLTPIAIAGASFDGRSTNRACRAWRVLAGEEHVVVDTDSLYAALCDAVTLDLRLSEFVLRRSWDQLLDDRKYFERKYNDRLHVKYLRVIRRLAILAGCWEFEETLPRKPGYIRCHLPYIFRSENVESVKHYAKRFMRKSNRADAIAGALKNGDRALIEWTINLA